MSTTVSFKRHPIGRSSAFCVHFLFFILKNNLKFIFSEIGFFFIGYGPYG